MPHGSQKTCNQCGGAITSEQIVHKEAGLVGGVLLCPNCVAKKRRELQEARQVAEHAGLANESGSSADLGESVGGVYLPKIKEGPDEADETLTLVDEEEMGHSATTQIRSFTTSSLGGEYRETGYKRPLAGQDEPATRCRTFHGKLTQPGLSHMDETVNEWLDAHPEIFVKSSTTAVGTFEGKTKEPHMLLTIFY